MRACTARLARLCAIHRAMHVNDRAMRAPAEEAVVAAAARRKAASTATPPGVRDLSRGGDTAGQGRRRERCAVSRHAAAGGAGAP